MVQKKLLFLPKTHLDLAEKCKWIDLLLTYSTFLKILLVWNPNQYKCSQNFQLFHFVPKGLGPIAAIEYKILHKKSHDNQPLYIVLAPR